MPHYPILNRLNPTARQRVDNYLYEAMESGDSPQDYGVNTWDEAAEALVTYETRPEQSITQRWDTIIRDYQMYLQAGSR